ncbi:MAG TPA: hypothetical protein HA346_06630 [Thermoplasmata archaeon]|nr:hypothetical protein [Thermoplasmata archaeon]
MDIIIGKLKLFEVPQGFVQFRKQIHDAKLGVLYNVSKRYPDADFSFYEVYGKWSLLDETNKLLSSFFDDFDIVEGQSPINSSPIDNHPKIIVDGNPVDLEYGELRLITADTFDELEQPRPNTVTALNFPITEDAYLKLKETHMLITDIEEVIPESLLGKELLGNIDKEDMLSQVLLSRLLRGKSICG